MSKGKIIAAMILVAFFFGMTEINSAVAEEKKAGKYLLLWEADNSKVPISLKERGDGWLLFLNMVKQDLEAGIMKDFGAFVGENNGYWIVEGSEAEVGVLAQKYVPFFTFKVYPVASVSQVEEILKALAASEQ